MICRCGLLDIVYPPDGGFMVVLSKGDATVRPVAETVRVEHLDCMTCVGALLRPGSDLFGDCGCRDAPTPVPAEPVTEHDDRSGSCACGRMAWEAARDGALIFEGYGGYRIWDRVDGSIVVTGGFCVDCGSFTRDAGELVRSDQAQT